MNKKIDNQEIVLQKVQENWGTLKGLVNRIENPEAREGAIHLCDDLHDRFAVAPASTRTDYVGCFVGGLVWHSLNTLRVMKALRSSLELEKVVSADSMIILGLFHDLGKLGNEREDYYLPQSSDWHREKLGQYYMINEDIQPRITIQQRTIFWLNKYHFPLEEKVIGALMSVSNSENEKMEIVNSKSETWESYLLTTAIRGAIIKYRNQDLINSNTSK
jgi:hypothetical protein